MLKILIANPFLTKLLGYESEEELKKRDLSKKDYFKKGYEREKFLKEIEEKGYFSGISEWKRKDGSTVWVRECAMAIKDEKGKTRYLGVVEDIAEFRNLIKRIKESEKKIQRIMGKRE